MNQLYRIFHLEIYQGAYKKNNYFEGWYYKIIDRDKKQALAIIPGISMKEGDAHAFIQLLDHQNHSYYFRYNVNEFWYNDKSFEIIIGQSYFSGNKMVLDITDAKMRITGVLEFDHIIRLPKTLYRPGIMGPFSYLPFMECYHGIINIHHNIRGELHISNKTVNFTKGFGYIEKDWGSSFPKSWIWFQSNHFQPKDGTVMFTVARIPWIGKAFDGFLCFLRIKSHILVFATYTGAKIRKLEHQTQFTYVIIENLRFKLELKVYHANGGMLKAPVQGGMSREIIESIQAIVKVRLSKRNGSILFEGTGTHTGVEIVL